MQFQTGLQDSGSAFARLVAGVTSLLFLLGIGCASYTHQRPVLVSAVVERGQTNYVVAYERVSVKMFLQKLSAAGTRSKVVDGDYQREVSLGKVGAIGDSDFVNAVSEGVAQSLMKAQSGGLRNQPLTQPR